MLETNGWHRIGCERKAPRMRTNELHTYDLDWEVYTCILL